MKPISESNSQSRISSLKKTETGKDQKLKKYMKRRQLFLTTLKAPEKEEENAYGVRF